MGDDEPEEWEKAAMLKAAHKAAADAKTANEAKAATNAGAAPFEAAPEAEAALGAAPGAALGAAPAAAPVCGDGAGGCWYDVAFDLGGDEEAGGDARNGGKAVQRDVPALLLRVPPIGSSGFADPGFSPSNACVAVLEACAQLGSKSPAVLSWHHKLYQ